jgi:arylsulfatase A-like enzyme
MPLQYGHMNVLVLNAHALHLGYLGCYGSDWVPMPNLDRLAAEGVVFDQHFVDSLGSPYRSAWTGRYGPPLAPDARAENVLGDLLESRSLISRFQAISDWNLLADGWARDLSHGKHGLFWLDLPSLAPPWAVSGEALDAVFAASEENDEPPAPWLDPPVGWIDPESADLDRVPMTYAAAVSEFDDRLGALFADLKHTKVYDDLLLILTADCGLALGEHGMLGAHRAWLHEEVVHLPLITRLPGGAEAGRRMAGLTQPVDLFATILEALDLPYPVTHGFSLWPLVRGEAEHVRTYVCAGARIGDSEEWMLRTAQWSLLAPKRVPEGDPPRGPRLYVKPDDRWEVNDVRQPHLDLAEGFEKTLGEFAAAARHPGPLQIPALANSAQA